MPRPPADPNAPPKEPKPDLPTTGIDHIRSVHPDAMKIWAIKGPKEQGGEFSGVLHSHEGHHRMVLLHQMPSGAYAVYERTDVATKGD